jgi:GntR family histidine utilization transcriptional repressor
VDIPVIRQEIEDRGRAYDYRLLTRETAPPPPRVQAELGLTGAAPCLHVTALHSADGAPYVHEDRWISLATVPQAAEADFTTVSANEWLLTTAPYTHGDITFAAEGAAHPAAEILTCPEGTPVFVIARITWDHGRAITTVRLTYAPGYRVRSEIGPATL